MFDAFAVAIAAITAAIADRVSMNVPLLNDFVVDLFIKSVLKCVQTHVDELACGNVAEVDSNKAAVVEFDVEARAGRV